MQEQHLREQGITIESHRSGSPHYGYWGYIVVQQNRDGEAILYGKASSGKEIPLDPFTCRKHALEYALSLAEESEEHDDCPPDEDPWIDIGGEG